MIALFVRFSALVVTGIALMSVSPAAARELATASSVADSSTMSLQSAALVRDIPANDTTYVSLLRPPASHKLRSGFVCLRPGQPGEQHSTENYEEFIVVISGEGQLQLEDRTLDVETEQVAYVPPHTKHFLRNTGSGTLRYVYIVTKVEP